MLKNIPVNFKYCLSLFLCPKLHTHTHTLMGHPVNYCGSVEEGIHSSTLQKKCRKCSSKSLKIMKKMGDDVDKIAEDDLTNSNQVKQSALSLLGRIG